MTIPNDNAWDSVIGNGTTGPFPVPFVLYSQAHMTLLEVVNNVATPLALGTDYVFSSWVADNKGQVANPAITFVNATTPGVEYVLLLTPPGTQLTAISNFSAFFPQLHEQEFDLEAQWALMLNERVNKSIKAPDFEQAGAANLTLPPIALRKSTSLTFDSNGNVVCVAAIVPPNTPVTVYMATLLLSNSFDQFSNNIHMALEDFDSPDSLTGTYDNYNPTGVTMSNVGLIVLQPIGDTILTGLQNPFTSPNTLPLGFIQRLTLKNYNTGGHTVTLKAGNAGSLGSNRFYMPSDVVLQPGQSVDMVYSQRYGGNLASGWAVIS